MQLVQYEETIAETVTYDPPTPRSLTDDEVLAALEKLPRDYHLPVMLVDIEGLSYRELAEALGIPIGTVMSRLHRGRKLLRMGLARYAHEAGYQTTGEGNYGENRGYGLP